MSELTAPPLPRKATLTGHTRSINQRVFSPDGKLFVTGSRDKRAMLWDVEKGTHLATLEGHIDGLESTALSPNGTLLATSGGVNDMTVRVWDVAERREKWVFPPAEGGPNVDVLAFSPGSDLLAGGDWDGVLRLWRMADGEEVPPLRGHERRIQDLAFSPDGSLLASGGSDETVRLWDVATRQLTGALPGHPDGVRTLAFLPDGETLITGGWDGAIRLWEVATLQPKRKPIRLRDSITYLEVSATGEWFVAGSVVDGVYIGTAEGNRAARFSQGFSGSFSPDGRFFAFPHQWPPFSLVVYRTKDWKAVAFARDAHRTPYRLCWSPDGKLIASTGDDREIHFWDASGLDRGR